MLEEAPVEARVVRDQQVVAGEREEASENGPNRGRAPQLRVAQARQARDLLGQRDAGVDERLELVDELEPRHAHGADLANSALRRRKAGRLQVEDDEGCVLEQGVVGACSEGDRRPRARDAAVPRRDLFQQREREPLGDRRRREQRPGGLDGRERALLLE